MKEIRFAELWLRQNLKLNKRWAYEYFYDLYSRDLYSTLLNITQSPAAAEIVFQDAFICFQQTIISSKTDACSLYERSLLIFKSKATQYILEHHESSKRPE